MPFLSFIETIFGLNVPLVSLIFLKRSLVFLILLFSFFFFFNIDHWERLSYLSLLFFGTLNSYGYIFSFLLCLLLLFFSQIFIRPPQTIILPFCISSSWAWFWSPPPVQCYEPPSIVLQALYLPDRIPWIYLSLLLYNHKGFDLGHTWNGLVVFPAFFSLNLNLVMKSLWAEPQSAPSLVFANCTELFHLWLQRI